jgi:non-specific serine/threonine protein kinase/serine/threonine-protein kinase
MVNSDWQQIKDIFNDAAELPESDRAAFLDRACSADNELRSEVGRWLAAERDPDADRLEHSPVASIKKLWSRNTDASLVGTRVGAFCLVRLIGSGGMGSVFEAVRGTEAGFEQRVALKIIMRGRDSKEMLSRFLHERKILASLEHSNIARFIDGGVTEEALPFYAMEYVNGEFIDDYCVKCSLSIRDRLELFLTVCDAVSYAHQHLIVHRDLKPANILVTVEGVVKLLDFGIAKLISFDEEAASTQTQQVALTPAYASPEQLRGERVTTTSDVYSLGVILYELLTGRRPHTIENSSPAELLNAVCETDPLRPSLAVTINERDLPREPRSIEMARLQKLLRGDLDNIVLKALHKDPKRRYASAELLAEDLRRYLAGRPVGARPDTLGYRATKFLKRNRLASVASSLIFLSLCAGIIATAHQNVQARRERSRAERRFNEVRALANKFVFDYHDRIARLHGAIELRALMIKDAAAYLDHLAADTADDADLQIELARAYLKLGEVQGAPYSDNVGDTAGASNSYKKGTALLEVVLRSHPDQLAAKAELSRAYVLSANLMARSGESGYPAYIQKSVALNEDLVNSNPDNTTYRSQLIRSYISFADYGGQLAWKDGNQRMAAYRKASALADRLYLAAPNDPDVIRVFITTHQRLSMNLYWAGDALKQRDGANQQVLDIGAEAEEHANRALQARAELEKVSSDLSSMLNIRIKLTQDLAMAMSLHNDPQAVVVLQELLEAARARAREDASNKEAQFDIALVLSNLATAHSAVGNSRHAVSCLREAVDLFDKALQVDKENRESARNLIEARVALGEALSRNGEFAEAADIFQRTAEENEGLKASFFQISVLLNVYRGDLFALRALTQSSEARRHADLSSAIEFYGRAQSEMRNVDFTVSNFDHTYLPEIVERKLAACRSQIGPIQIAGENRTIAMRQAR